MSMRINYIPLIKDIDINASYGLSEQCNHGNLTTVKDWSLKIYINSSVH